MTPVRYIPTPYSYSSAVVAGDQVYLGLHRGFGDTFEQQFEGTIAYLKDTLAKLDLSLASIVKVTVWIKNIHDLPVMEKLFHAHFEEGRFPARMTATTEFFDADCLLMIEGVAYAGE